MSEVNPYVEFENRIADAIMRELTRRKGFYAWWDEIDRDVQEEIRHELARAVIAQVIV